MKRQHRVPVQHLRTTDEISPAYQREVDLATARGERLYAEAQKRLDAAETRAQRLERQTPRPSAKAKRAIAEAWAVVELRRMELEKYARLMASTGQPAANRGRKSFRPLPVTHGSI